MNNVGHRILIQRFYCSTKKDAKHECAKWAILGMKIPGIDVEDTNKKRDGPPIHPKLLKQQQNQQLGREGDEIGRLMTAGQYFSCPCPTPS